MKLIARIVGLLALMLGAASEAIVFTTYCAWVAYTGDPLRFLLIPFAGIVLGLVEGYWAIFWWEVAGIVLLCTASLLLRRTRRTAQDYVGELLDFERAMR